MAEKITAKEMLDMITRWEKDHEGEYAPGDRQIAAELKNLRIQLSRKAGTEDVSSSPGARAAVKAIGDNKRDDAMPGTQYNERAVEPRSAKDQPKTFEDAKEGVAGVRQQLEEAHSRFMDAVRTGGDNA